MTSLRLMQGLAPGSAKTCQILPCRNSGDDGTVQASNAGYSCFFLSSALDHRAGAGRSVERHRGKIQMAYNAASPRLNISRGTIHFRQRWLHEAHRSRACEFSAALGCSGLLYTSLREEGENPNGDAGRQGDGENPSGNAGRQGAGINGSSQMAETELNRDVSSSQSGRTNGNIAVFVSGGGSNFRAIHSAVLRGSIKGIIVAVVSDKPGCRGCDYAREHGIPVLAFPAGKHAPEGLSTDALVNSLRSYGIDFVVLAGYMRLLPVDLVRAFPRSILNIHPALLPAFGGKGYYGMKVHEAVIRSGVRYSGATVHFVDEKYDTGPIVAQRTVPVFPLDTPEDVAARVLSQEHIVYSEVVAALCDSRIEWRDDGVPIMRTADGEYR